MKNHVKKQVLISGKFMVLASIANQSCHLDECLKCSHAIHP